MFTAYRFEFTDRLTPWIKGALARFCLFAARILAPIKPQKALKLAMMSSRFRHHAPALALVKRLFERENNGTLGMLAPPADFEKVVKRTIVLMWPTFDGLGSDDARPTLRDKGILLISYTDTCDWFLQRARCDLLADYFHIVLEPSSAGYMDPEILAWESVISDKIYVQSAEEKDRVALNVLDSIFVPLSVGASNWVDHQRFAPQSGVEKVFDAVYVANTSPVKRVYRYLKAIGEIVQRGHTDYRALLVCARFGGDGDEIGDLIRYYGIGEQVEVRYQLKLPELVHAINQSKVNILLSRKEGSNRSLFESIFCDVPALCLANVIGPNRSYFNEYTGMLVEDDFLADALLKIRDDYQTFAPRRWAMRHLSAEVTLSRVVDIIEHHTGVAIDRSHVLVKVNTPEVSYINQSGDAAHEWTRQLLMLFSSDDLADDLSAALAALRANFSQSFTNIETLS